MNSDFINSIKNANTSKMASPYYWAGHRLVGEELLFVKIENEKHTSTFWLWVGGVSGGLILISIWLYYNILAESK